MPRYFFHVHDGIDRLDTEGVELPSLSVARAEAIVFAGETIKNAGLCGGHGDEWCLTVTDDSGVMLFRMDFIVAESSPM